MYTVTRKRNIGVQVGSSTSCLKDQGTQCSYAKGSYGRKNNSKILTYDELRDSYLWNRDFTLEWLKQEGIIASSPLCDRCNEMMTWTACQDRGDGYRWECRRKAHGKKRMERSIREGSWFEHSNLTIEEVLKLTYWWTQGLDQWQMKQQLGLGPNTAIDWDMFCRELCEVTLENRNEVLGGEGKFVQIDESKIGKRKYHRGHMVEGQWVFGGIEK